MKLIHWIKRHKLIFIATLLATVFTITFIVLFTTTLVKNEKDKQNRTFLERDHTEIVCKKSEKIGSAIIKYKTKDNHDSDNWKRTLFLYCTENPVINGYGNDYLDLKQKIDWFFYKKYEKKMNLKFANLTEWIDDTYSKEWNKKYFIKSNNFDGYFIN